MKENRITNIDGNVIHLASVVVHDIVCCDRSVEYQQRLKLVYSLWRQIEDELFEHREKGLRSEVTDPYLNLEIEQTVVQLEQVLDYIKSMNSERRKVREIR